MSDSKSSNDFLKGKASQFISLVSGLAEKKIHQIVDRGAEHLSGIERGIQDAYHTIIENFEDWSNRFKEKEPGEFVNGDLVISPVDIVYTSGIFSVRPNGDTTKQSETKIIKAGEVFEFREELIPYLKTPLFEADTKAAIEWARMDELNKLKVWSDTNTETSVHRQYVQSVLESYIDNRKSDITGSSTSTSQTKETEKA